MGPVAAPESAPGRNQPFTLTFTFTFTSAVVDVDSDVNVDFDVNVNVDLVATFDEARPCLSYLV